MNDDEAVLHYDDSELVKIYPAIQESLIEPLKIKDNKNLVLNPGFDKTYKYKKISDDPKSAKHVVPYWIQARKSPDAFTKNGQSYAGFRVVGKDYEILGGRLKKPLEATKNYCFQMKIRLKERNHFAVSSAGLMLSAEPINFKEFSKEDFAENPPYILSADSVLLAMRQQWQVISGTFKAKGEEAYIYVGVFPAGMIPSIVTLDSASPRDDISTFGEVYYYVDDIVVVESDTSVQCPCNAVKCEEPEEKTEEKDTAQSTQTIFVYKSIQFEPKTAKLLQPSFTALDSVMIMLDQNPKMRMLITVHTDNQGDEEANQELSEIRAKAVRDYMIENGIDSARLEYEGKGESEPIDSNKNAKGRANNRRVVFTVIKKE
jgi:outer membrane protein OmpA-like peptidoglycan-associated protein